MTSQTNPNAISITNNPFLGKILFYTKKASTDIWHENMELLLYAKNLLRFYKLKKHLPNSNFKLKRTSLNNLYFFTFFSENSRQSNKTLTALRRFINYKESLGPHKFSQLSYIKKKIAKKNIITLPKKKKNLKRNNITILKNNDEKNILKPKNNILSIILKNQKLFNTFINIKTKLTTFRRKKYLRASKFEKIKFKFIKNLLKQLSLYQFLQAKKFDTLSFFTQILNILNVKTLFNLQDKKQLFSKFLQKFSKHLNIRKNQKLFLSIHTNKTLKKKFKKKLKDKTKSKIYIRSNKYLSLPKSTEYFKEIRKSFINLSLKKTNFVYKTNYKNKIQKNNHYFLNKFKNILVAKNKPVVKYYNNLSINGLTLVNKNILKNIRVNKHFLYGLLINNRLNFFDKVTLFENECKFFFKINYSNLRLIYQKNLSLMSKIITSFKNILNEEDLPDTKKISSKNHNLLSEGIKYQNFDYFTTNLNRYLRRQNTKRLFNASTSILQDIKTIFHEHYLNNLFIYSRFQKKRFNVDMNISQPQMFLKKIPYSLTLRYKGKLKKAGRKQRSLLFLKNPFLPENIELLANPMKFFKYETITSNFASHFKRGGTGGFKFTMTYLYI